MSAPSHMICILHTDGSSREELEAALSELAADAARPHQRNG